MPRPWDPHFSLAPKVFRWEDQDGERTGQPRVSSKMGTPFLDMSVSPNHGSHLLLLPESHQDKAVDRWHVNRGCSQTHPRTVPWVGGGVRSLSDFPGNMTEAQGNPWAAWIKPSPIPSREGKFLLGKVKFGGVRKSGFEHWDKTQPEV